MQHIAIYIRVSTDEQAEHGYSIEIQKQKLEAFCISQGWDYYKFYIDDGFTGTKMERPALKRMIRHIEEGNVSTVLVHKLDRLSRKQKDVLHLLEDVFDKNNVTFKSSTEPFDTASSFGKATIGILAVFAQLERDMIVERMTLGRRQRVDAGKWYGGRIPFGYIWNKEIEMLEIVPEEAMIIKQIYKLYLQGHSRLSIAEWATSRTNKRTIDHNIVMEILKRPVYSGKFKNSGRIVQGKHEAIIPQEMWDAVQRETEKRKEGQTPLGEYLLTGLLKCGICGGPIVHVKRVTKRSGKTYAYELYACKKQHVRVKDRTGTCTLGYPRRELVEKYVIQQIKSLGTNPKKVNDLLRGDDDSSDAKRHIDTISDSLKKIDVSLENLYDAIESGDIKASSVRSRIKKLEEQRESLENDLDEMLDNSTRKHDKKIFIDTITQIGLAWDYFDEDEKKAAIRKIVNYVTLTGKTSDPKIDWLLA